PNPALRGETAWSGEVGVTATAGGGLWLDGALFQSEYRDLIGPAPAPGQLLVFQFQNVQRARVRGLDLGAKLGVAGGRLGLEAAYTYLDAVDLASGGPLPYRSRHNATLTVSALGGLVALHAAAVARVERHEPAQRRHGERARGARRALPQPRGHGARLPPRPPGPHHRGGPEARRAGARAAVPGEGGEPA